MPAPTPPSAPNAVPPTPDRNEGEDIFVPKMFNFLDWFATFQSWMVTALTFITTSNSWVESQAIAAAASATAAGNSATNAAISASNALTYSQNALLSPGTQATSTSSMSIGTGSKSFTLAQTGKSFVVGQFVSISVTAGPATAWMNGAITAFTAGTGAITVNVVSTLGSGTYSAWTIAQSSPVNLTPDTAITVASSRNELRWSTDLLNAAWTTSGPVGVAAETTINDHRGGFGAFILTDDSAGVAESLNGAIAVASSAGRTMCAQLKVRRGTSPTFRIYSGFDSVNSAVDCTWTSDTSLTMVPNGSTIPATILDYGYEVIDFNWVRVWVAVTAIAAATAIRLNIYPAVSSTTGTLYVHEPQLELDRFVPGMYTPTTTAAAAGGGIRQQNKCLYSDDFANAGWNKVRSTVTSNVMAFHDGLVLVDKLVVDATAANSHYVQANPDLTITAGSYNTLSVFFKAGEYTGIRLSVADVADSFQCTFNPDTNAATNSTTGLGATHSSGIQNMGSGIYRLWVCGKINTTSTAARLQIIVADNTGNITLTDATATKGIFIYGAQFNQGFRPLDYKKTTSAPVDLSAYTFEKNKSYELDSRLAPLFVAMPSDVDFDSTIALVDSGGNAAASNITISNNGSKIFNQADTFVINQNNRPFYFKKSKTFGWSLR